MAKLKGLLSQLQYESGEAAVTPAQAEILMQVSGLLRDVKDAEILVEGHADDMPIGPALKQTFASNQELSDARANNAVRYLVEDGGIDPAALSATARVPFRPSRPLIPSGIGRSSPRGQGGAKPYDCPLSPAGPCQWPWGRAGDGETSPRRSYYSCSCTTHHVRHLSVDFESVRAYIALDAAK